MRTNLRIILDLISSFGGVRGSEHDQEASDQSSVRRCKLRLDLDPPLPTPTASSLASALRAQ